MFKFVFCATFLFHALTSGLQQKPWFDDIDGPGFLRGAEQQTQEEQELDSSNDLLDDMARVARNEIVTTDTSLKESIICNVAAHPNGVITTKWDNSKNPLNALHYTCNAYPTMVNLTMAAGVSMLHDTMLLHRCVGSCPSSNLRNCTVIRQEEVKVQYMDRDTYQTGFVTVYNHTQCGFACMTRNSDCDDKKQKFNADTCTCECRGNITTCNQTLHTWDDKDCECTCKTATKACDITTNHTWNPKICDCDCTVQKSCDSALNLIWNPNTCDCVCTDRVKNRCQRKNKVPVVNSQGKCECECPTPRPSCPPGTSFQNYNCTCVDDTSVITK